MGRFTENGLLEQLFDETVALAIKQKLVSPHTTLDGTLVQASASHKSFVPIEVFLKPEDYKKRLRSLDSRPEHDAGNPTITFRGEPPSNPTHVSSRGQTGEQRQWDPAIVGYTVNGQMENRHRLLLGINVESFRGLASETDGGATCSTCSALLQ